MILLSGLALFLVGLQLPASPAGSTSKCTSYEFSMRVQMPEHGGLEEMDNRRSMFPSEILGRMWKAGASIRLEVKMGEKRDRFQILTPSALYTLMPSTKRGTKAVLTKPMFRSMIAHGSPFALATPCDVKTIWPSAKKFGSEVVRGIACEVWVAQVAGGTPSTVKIWMPQGKTAASPLRMEIITKMGQRSSPSGIGTADQIRRTVELSKRSEGQALPAEAFVVPKDYKISPQRGLSPAPKR